MTSAVVGVLLMAYGSSPSMDDEAIHAYLRHILQFYRRTDPDPEAVAHLKARYQAIGGSPLYSITERLAAGLQHALDRASPGNFHVYWAMKHSPPFIEDVVPQIARDGFRQAVGVALAPFRSRLSTDGYYRVVQEANQGLPNPMTWAFVDDWHLHPWFLNLWQARIEDARRGLPETALVVFTNHSLPERIRRWDDPYPVQFEATARALAERCRLTHWTAAYQSAGGGAEAWLGPDLVDILRTYRENGGTHALVAPIGFLMDHLEVLYDIDVEAQAEARAMGLHLVRTRMPNDDPRLIDMLADVVLKAARQIGGWVDRGQGVGGSERVQENLEPVGMGGDGCPKA
ncbi:MAG: ferrochelatase [Acidobacteria bacterium]|nr:ferrochelatase [Acidobacteriota bacterium]MDW7985002.1 ferrochelatase [Acidobacteriota bacterium]